MQGNRNIIKGFIIIFAAAIMFGSVNMTSAASINLTQKQKENYYKQYTLILADINKKYPNSGLSLEPMDKFNSNDWVKPTTFKKIADKRATTNFVFKPKHKSDDSFDGTTKTKSMTVSGKNTKTISITGSFTTQLSSTEKRQLFSGISAITSKLAIGTGSWTQTGYEYKLIDGGRTYVITVGGKYTDNGISQPFWIDVEFYCNAFGSVG
ncbi:hypothetical protein HPT25_21385 [Bacillus sp. BRMEA1]|uniref:hypothetical protein n=1 Tax=Neobacillus endophyticus TaxID=2738405 RepID=UPI0015631624|nr:hypothetical protein [Neobacillus endophyticus]NRD79893.1 hypothetical protein [Neobacillus endophyticus]